MTRFFGLNILSKVYVTTFSLGLKHNNFFSFQRSNHSHRTKFLLNKLSSSDDLLTQKEILGGILTIKELRKYNQYSLALYLVLVRSIETSPIVAYNHKDEAIKVLLEIQNKMSKISVCAETSEIQADTKLGLGLLFRIFFSYIFFESHIFFKLFLDFLEICLVMEFEFYQLMVVGSVELL